MKLQQKFIIPISIITVVAALLVSYVIARQIRIDALKRAQDVTAEYIQSKASEYLLPEHFDAPVNAEPDSIFEHFQKVIRTKEVLKIKAFNTNGDIIFSTAKENIGQKSDSPNYFAARDGKIAVQIKPPLLEQSNIDMAGFKQVMEIYVPIRINGKIQGVIETYYKMDLINESIRETTNSLLLVVGILALSLLISTYVLLKVVVINPITKLREVSDKISNGVIDVELPDIRTNDEIRALNDALKGVFAAIELLRDEIQQRDAAEKRG